MPPVHPVPGRPGPPLPAPTVASPRARAALVTADLSVVLRGRVRLELHPPPDYVSDAIRATGDFYEVAVLEEIARRVRGGVLVDAGAMIGNHTGFLASFVAHSAIHAFEPAPVNLALLGRNALAWDTVRVHPVALSDRPGRVHMTVELGNLGHAVVDATDRWGPLEGPSWEVQAITLDSLGLEDVTLLKVDVEWHEPQVLAGAADTIRRCRPLIVIEDWQHAYGAQLMEPLGYRLAVAWERAHQTFMYEPR